jgi:hypothetical protein
MAPGTAMGVGIATSLVVNGIMIVIFYLIHKYYWQPHRRGEPAFGGRLYKLQRYIHEHDFGQRPVHHTIIIAGLFIIIVSGIIMGATASMGNRMFPGYEPEIPAADDSSELEDMVEFSDSESGSGGLNEGMGMLLTFNSEPDKYIKEVMVTVTWTDQSDIGIFKNQPDTFTVTIMGANTTVSVQDSNPPGGEGSISAELSFPTDEVSQIIETNGENYEFIVQILLDEAGNYQGPLGVVDYPEDTGNDYQYEIEIIWLLPE